MAYSDLGDVVSGGTITEAWGDGVRANFQAGVPDIYTTKGDLAVATAADTAARLAVGANDAILVAASGETTGLAWQIQPACRVYNDANIDPATSSWVTLTFNSERFDTNALHDTSTNTSRITIPANGGGLYTIGASIAFGTSGITSGEAIFGLRLLLNGSTVIGQNQFVTGTTSAAGVNFSRVVSTLYALSATNYVEAQVYTNWNVDVIASGNHSPEFWAIWQRRQ